MGCCVNLGQLAFVFPLLDLVTDLVEHLICIFALVHDLIHPRHDLSALVLLDKTNCLHMGLAGATRCELLGRRAWLAHFDGQQLVALVDVARPPVVGLLRNGHSDEVYVAVVLAH